MCTGWRSPTCCIFVIFWYTETDAGRKGTGRGRGTSYDWHDCGCLPIISSHLSITGSPCLSGRLNTDSSTRLIYTYHL